MNIILPYHCLLPVIPEKCPMSEDGFARCPQYMYCGTIEISNNGEYWLAGLSKLGLKSPSGPELAEIEHRITPYRILAKLMA